MKFEQFDWNQFYWMIAGLSTILIVFLWVAIPIYRMDRSAARRKKEKKDCEANSLKKLMAKSKGK